LNSVLLVFCSEERELNTDAAVEMFAAEDSLDSRTLYGSSLRLMPLELMPFSPNALSESWVFPTPMIDMALPPGRVFHLQRARSVEASCGPAEGREAFAEMPHKAAVPRSIPGSGRPRTKKY